MTFLAASGRDIFSIISDCAGILGFCVSVVTMIFALHVRRKILENSERHKFLHEYEKVVDRLKSIEQSIKEDNLFNTNVLKDLWAIKDQLRNDYPSVLHKSRASLNRLEKKIKPKLISEKAIEKYDRKYQTEILGELRKLIANLDKDRELI